MAKQRGKAGGSNSGGSNNGQRHNDDDDDDEGGDGGGFNDQQLDALSRLVNSAVSSHLGRKLKGTLSSLLDEQLAPLREQIEQVGTGRRRARDDEGGDEDDDDEAPPAQQRGKGKNKGAAPRDPEFIAMQKRVAKMEEERKAEQAQAIARERDSTLREHLTKIGVDPNRMRGALAVVGSAIKRDEKTGTFSYTAKRDGYDDELDLDVGIKEWAGTDEGKSYLAPQGNGQQRQGSGMPRLGAGGGAGGTQRSGTTRPVGDPKAAKQQRQQEAMTVLTQSIGELGGSVVGIG